MPRRDWNTPHSRNIHHSPMHSGSKGRGGDAKIREDKHKDAPPKKSMRKKNSRHSEELLE